ncbi:MAG: ferritin-like domain-containing protein, partial [Solirubrobacterales bacterium]
RTAALGAGALAAAGLLRPGLAGAQSPDDEDLRDFLVEAISLEQLAVLAYATAARDGDTEIGPTLEIFRDQEQAHANALRQALDTLGFDLPDAPDSTTDTGAFEDVDGLDTDASERLLDLLDELDGLSSPRRFLAYLARLEDEQISYYTSAGPTADSVDLTTTSAEIAGCQAQHVLVLLSELGRTDVEAAAAPATTALEAVPAGDSGE